MHQGSCLCASVKYQIESNLKTVVHCHCRFCRKAHGSAFTTVLFMPFSGLTVVQGAEFLERYRVEKVNSDRCFCNKCGSRLFNHQPSSGMIGVVVGTLDIDDVLIPLAHFNVESKSPWFEINDRLPQFQSTPAPAEFGKLLSG